jgi:hypothetical protein
LEEAGLLLLGHADAGVGDGIDGQRNRAALRESGRVGEQVEEAPAHLGQVGVHRAEVGSRIDDQRVAVHLHQRLRHGDDIAEQVRHLEVLQVEVHPAPRLRPGASQHS